MVDSTMADVATRSVAAAGASVLSVQNLEAWYGESHILHGINFDVNAGEVVTLLGRNGAGKTTTLKSVMGIIGKRTGSIRFDGQDITRASSDRIARMGVAFCPEERGIFASLDVRENLLLPPVVRVQMALHPWVAYAIMPLFALANAGVNLGGVDLSGEGARSVVAGVALALVLGKPAGIMGASWLAVRLGCGNLPAGMNWAWLALVGGLAGIGFTMSLFIAMLAFGDETLLASAKLGVLIASVCAGIIGLLLGVMLSRLQKR